MFQDEAGFGRISEPANCWAPPGLRPTSPSQRVREYKTVYGAVSPLDGDSFFMVLDKSNTENMSIFMTELSKKFPDTLILLCLDRASWHKSNDLKIHKNIERFYIPPRTPQMNPIELVWREIRKWGFKNRLFDSINAVVQQFHNVISTHVTNDKIKSLTLWPWVENLYNTECKSHEQLSRFLIAA